jgi:hypothetical protein
MVALPASAQDSDIPLDYAMTSEDRLAQQLNNPLANLITVPVQNNFDFGGWRDGEGFRYTLVAQPVLPFKLNNEWNLIQARRSGELGFPVAHDIRVSSKQCIECPGIAADNHLWRPDKRWQLSSRHNRQGIGHVRYR